MTKSIISSQGNELTVNKGKIGSINLYEITEEELEKLSSGNTDSICLNFAIFTISIAFSFLITLLTLEINSNRIYITFITITIIGFLAGIILLIIWLITRISLKKIVNKIKARINKK